MNDRVDPSLLERLRTARERAYAPYSKFRVAAAVVTPAESVFVGCNVETVHYKSVCAEASAISAMVGAGEREIARVVVLSSGEKPCPPCGDCRQRLLEFGGPDTEVLLIDDEGGVRARYRLGELLPAAFGPGSLDRD